MVVGHWFYFDVSVKGKIIFFNTTKTAVFIPPFTIVTSISKVLKIWVYFKCYTPKEMPKCAKFTHTFQPILHSNCI